MASSATDDLGPSLEARLRVLEQEMPQLRTRHPDVFGFANAWAERYDAILAATPADARATVEARLSRIGIRWGVMPGTRVTTEFRAIDVEALMHARLRQLRGAA